MGFEAQSGGRYAEAKAHYHAGTAHAEAAKAGNDSASQKAREASKVANRETNGRILSEETRAKLAVAQAQHANPGPSSTYQPVGGVKPMAPVVGRGNRRKNS